MTLAPVEHRYEYSDTQRQALSLIAEAPEGSTTFIGFGGAAGGGKTDLIANGAIEVALQCPGSQQLIGRKDFVDLKETTLAAFDAALPPGLDVRRYDSAPVYRDIRIDSTKPYSRVYFKGLKDAQSLGSTAYGGVWIDEGSEVDLMIVRYLITRLRHRPERKWFLFTSFNPFPGWCVDWFMKGQTPNLSELTDTRVDFHFVRSRIEDNPHLRSGYKEMMEATLDPFTRAVMVDGDPDAALGGLLYFDRERIESLLTPDPGETLPTQAMPNLPADGDVWIWERPINGERYYGGADTADGKGEAMFQQQLGKVYSDRNCCAIYKASDNTQVAEIYGRQEEPEFAKLLYHWGQAYNNALLCVENNRPAVLRGLQLLRYGNLYFAEPRVDMHVAQVVNPVRRLEYGYNTNVETRPVLLSQFREALHARVITPRSKRFRQEGLNFLAGVKPEAAPGQHDDVVLAHALAEQARRALRAGRGSNERRSFSVAPLSMSR